MKSNAQEIAQAVKVRGVATCEDDTSLRSRVSKLLADERVMYVSYYDHDLRQLVFVDKQMVRDILAARKRIAVAE